MNENCKVYEVLENQDPLWIGDCHENKVGELIKNYLKNECSSDIEIKLFDPNEPYIIVHYVCGEDNKVRKFDKVCN